MPAAASLKAGALPIGLAHRVKLKNDIAHGAVVRWSDVEIDAGDETVKTRRARYIQQGLWGLVDQRAVRLSAATGRTDARLVAAIREVIDAETDTSTGTRSRLIRRVVKTVEATYGPGVVPLPGAVHVVQGD